MDDASVELYYLKSRHYHPALCRFLQADTVLGKLGAIYGHNLYTYCFNSPITHKDSDGHYIDTALDVVSVVYDVVDILSGNNGIAAWGALTLDIASLILPGLTGGGKLIRFACKSDDVADAAKYADKVFETGEQFFSNAKRGIDLHNTYDPIQDSIDKSYKLLNEVWEESGTKVRPDALDLKNRVIHELKPFNKRAFKRAVKQTQKYVALYGETWTIVIDMYYEVTLK